MSTPAATFRAKTNFMKTWRPQSPPSIDPADCCFSRLMTLFCCTALHFAIECNTNNNNNNNNVKNRDRLELYALHKQAVSGDAPTKNDSPDASVADKAKLSAWRSKRGLSQSDAMQQYVNECDRQIRVYGTRDAGETNGGASMEAGNASREGTGSAPQTPFTNAATPQNTPANLNDEDDNNVLLCPRGLAAIPLLCAAASESRTAYLARLQVTAPNNGWWAKQEPLCLEMNNPLSFPEKLIIGLAEQVEKVSLLVGNFLGDGHAVSTVSPRVVQAFLWPVHNIFLALWILWILTSTYLGSVAIMSQTLLFGAKRTNTPLGRVFLEEINPSARAVETLCEQHQTIGVRLTGLVLMPLMMLCDFSNSVVNQAGILAGSLFFVLMGLLTWWYWICVLPWLAMCGVSVAVMSGWCFGLIELSGN
ncbi:hypothetical protein ACHAW6_010254 [Cyclotella cf. meneghiniana]